MKHSVTPVDCSACDECTYIGEGDFVCQKYIHEPDKAMVISDWAPTVNHMQCKTRRRKRRRNGNS